ncbi:MAG: PAS domain S-box protein [Balneolaceae bacterium]|nr:PAS domain S-box protein [Balneolaceae bacterium]
MNTKPVIMVCLSNPADSELIMELLPDRYEIIVSEDELLNDDFDICVIDKPSFEIHKKEIVSYKEQKSPVQVPFLLFVKGDQWSRTLDPAWNIVDDVIPVPTPAPILISRIDTLLQSRKHSLELKRKTEELELFKQAIDATNVGVTIADAQQEDDPIVYANEGFRKMTGYNIGEIIGKNCRFLQNDNREQKAVKDIRSYIVNSQQGNARLKNYKKDGTPFWNELSIAPIEDDNGVVTHFIGIQKDVTELINTQDALRERNKEKSCLYRIGSLGRKHDDIDKILQEAASIIPDGWQYPEITEAIIEFDGKQFKSSGYRDAPWSLTSETEIEEKNLLVKVVYREERPTEDEGPFIAEEVELIGAIRDTLFLEIESILSRQKLEERERFWAQLIEKNPALVQIIDNDKIKFINKSGAALYGIDDPEELIGKPWKDFVNFGEANVGVVDERIKNVLKGEASPPRIFKAWTADDNMRYVELQSVPIMYEGKRMMMTVGQNVTERVNFEKELQQSLNEKEVLLQEIHHRVKNNLAVVSGLLQIQRFSSDDENVNKVLANSEMRIRSMALIHEKLYQSNSLSEIDFKAYIEDLLKTIRKTIQFDEDIEVQINCDSVSVNVNQAVPCALILNELVSNAMEHAFEDSSGGKITINIHESEGRLVVKVADNGKGMPEDFDLNSVETMGFTIVQTLFKQLEADFEINTENGSQISFSFEKRDRKGSSSNLV